MRAMDRRSSHKPHGVLGVALRRARRLSFPARYPLVQFPNASLTVAILARACARPLQGTARRRAHDLRDAALGVWACGELRAGANSFRRLLGAVYIARLALSTVDRASKKRAGRVS
jgi:hypothetical protein